MALQTTCPCPKPHEHLDCPCTTLAYDIIPSISNNINSWTQTNNLVSVSRIGDNGIVRITPNSDFVGNIPIANEQGYNSAVQLSTTTQANLYIGFKVARNHTGKMIFQAVLPIP